MTSRTGTHTDACMHGYILTRDAALPINHDVFFGKLYYQHDLSEETIVKIMIINPCHDKFCTIYRYNYGLGHE